MRALGKYYLVLPGAGASNMFCSACGTANEDGAATCRLCGEVLILKRTKGSSKTITRKWVSKGLLWFLLPVAAMLASAGVGVYYYGANREFEITGELLYRNDGGVHRVPGALVQVFEEQTDGTSPETRLAELHISSGRYAQLMQREFSLRVNGPGSYDATQDVGFASLGLAPLSKMDWSWWEIERLQNCHWGTKLLLESLKSPVSVATTSTDLNGHFWLKLKRGKYVIAVESEVPSFWRNQEGSLHTADTSQPATGNAFWVIPTTVTANQRIVSAETECSPD